MSKNKRISKHAKELCALFNEVHSDIFDIELNDDLNDLQGNGELCLQCVIAENIYSGLFERAINSLEKRGTISDEIRSEFKALSKFKKINISKHGKEDYQRIFHTRFKGCVRELEQSKPYKKVMGEKLLLIP